MDLDQFKDQFNTSIVDAKSPKERVELIVALLCTAFGAGKDEVALFSFDKSREVLVFIWPKSLNTIGSIPLNAHRCLVSKTAVEQKGGLDNRFSSTPHLHMFEHFLSEKDKRIPIQKIMSAPILSGGILKGVVQIARKGQDRESSGADFNNSDLEFLSATTELFAGYL